MVSETCIKGNCSAKRERIQLFWHVSLNRFALKGHESRDLIPVSAAEKVVLGELAL
jgi:hypothetical protein